MLSDVSAPALQRPHLLDVRRVFRFLLHPVQEIQHLAAEESALWLFPMLILSLTLLLTVVLGGFLQARTAAMGEVPLPPDWQSWTPEMQNNYMQAIQATRSPTYVYLIPAVLGWIKLWLGWFVLSGLFHLFSTILGGRGKMSSALNIVAWASLPFALRDLLRVAFMLLAHHPISSPGLSGFSSAVFLSQMLANVDLFLLWQAALLILGFRFSDGLSRGKSVAVVLLVLLIALVAQAGWGALSAGFRGRITNQPFF
ncbi:MAG: Yip1 family protein [Anaerolineae bacterium]